MTDHSTLHTSPTRRDFLRNAALASGTVAAVGANTAVAAGGVLRGRWGISNWQRAPSRT